MVTSEVVEMQAEPSLGTKIPAERYCFLFFFQASVYE